MPEYLWATFDAMDDRYLGAFENYPDSVKLVVSAWGTTGEVDGEPLPVLVATAGHIITGFVDTYFDAPIDPEEFLQDSGEPFEPDDQIKHDEPGYLRRRALLARLRAVSPTDWLIIHDVDEGEVESWLPLGFVKVAPPPDVPPDEAATVLSWGALPEDIYSLLRARGLAWRLTTHRYHRDS